MALTDKLTAIADAIRGKTGNTDKLSLDSMVTEIESISGEEIDIPKLLSYDKYSLTEVKDTKGNVTEIKSYAFAGMSLVTEIDFPFVSIINGNAFEACYALTKINLPQVTRINATAFRYCGKLTNVNLPLLVYLGGYTFESCSILSSVYCPLLKEINSCDFESCHKLTSVYIPLVTSIGGMAFAYSESFVTLDLPSATSIGYACFNGCTALKNLMIRTTSQVCTYNGTWGDPPNANLKIYVPSALLDSYKTATNWVRLADHFVALEDYTVDGTTTGEMNTDADGNIVARS